MTMQSVCLTALQTWKRAGNSNEKAEIQLQSNELRLFTQGLKRGLLLHRLNEDLRLIDMVIILQVPDGVCCCAWKPLELLN